MPELSSLSSADDLFQVLFDVSLTGVVLLRPRYDTGELPAITDFVFERLNAAARRLLPLATGGNQTLLECYPRTVETGVFAFFRDAFLTGGDRSYEVREPADGLGAFAQLAARRSGELLVVSFAEAAPAPGPAVEHARRQTLQSREMVYKLNEMLAAANEELQLANLEVRHSNAELRTAQQQLRVLNRGLEARITEQTLDARAARLEAERERSRLERLFMQAPAGICILDGPSMVFELVNPAFQRMFPGRRLAGLPLLQALPELQDHPAWHTLQQVYRTGQTHQEQAMLIPVARHEGGPLEDVYFNYIQQARFDERHHVDGLLVFAFEVSGQVRAQQAAEASARQLRLITDALPVLIAYIDREQRYQFVNEAYRPWFNRDPGLLLGRPVREVLGELAYQQVAHYITQALAGERVDFATRMPYREGFVRYIRTSYVPDVREGEVVGFFGLVTDVTEQELARQQVQHLNEELKARNQELYAANEQLTRTNVDLDNFIYAASHDLKSPITNIEGLLTVLDQQLPPASRQAPEVEPVLGMMHDSVLRFKRTIELLSDVTKLQKENSQPATDVALAAVVDEVRLDLLPQLQQAGAELDLAINNCSSVSFSAKNLRSVVYNLLSNALKFRHPGRPPHVRISCRSENGFTVLEVQDNGLGLDDAQQQELFTMFRRLHTHVEGTGIGLYMVKRMVENVGGYMRVHSTPGVGSTFAVHFPA